MPEGTFVGLQELAQALVGIGPVKAMAGKAQRQHEEMQRNWPVPERRPHLAPVNLALLAWPGLKARLGQHITAGQFGQRRHEARDRLVTAAKAVLLAQLLIKDPGRVTNFRRALLEPASMRLQQRLRHRRPPIRLPGGLALTAPHRLAIQLQRPCNRRYRPTLLEMQTANLRPPFFSHHRDLQRGLLMALNGALANFFLRHLHTLR